MRIKKITEKMRNQQRQKKALDMRLGKVSGKRTALNNLLKSTIFLNLQIMQTDYRSVRPIVW